MHTFAVRDGEIERIRNTRFQCGSSQSCRTGFAGEHWTDALEVLGGDSRQVLFEGPARSATASRRFRIVQSNNSQRWYFKRNHFKFSFQVVNREKLTKRYLISLVNARAKRLVLNNFASLEEVEKYADETVSNLYFLILEGSGVRNVHADHAASHLGKAQGIVQQLRYFHVRYLELSIKL